MQNMRGKTLASVYSPRANAFAGVSTPLTWEEVEDGVTPQDFTIPTFAARLEAAGDLWQQLRRAKGVSLRLPDTPSAPTSTRKRPRTATSRRTASEGRVPVRSAGRSTRRSPGRSPGRSTRRSPKAK
jgi:DNA primase